MIVYGSVDDNGNAFGLGRIDLLCCCCFYCSRSSTETMVMPIYPQHTAESIINTAAAHLIYTEITLKSLHK